MEKINQSMTNNEELSFTEHLKELRNRLIKSLLSIGVGFLVCWFFAGWILEGISHPIKPYLEGTEGKLIFTSPLEKFLSYIKVSLFAGVFLSCPYWLLQVWKFIAPGLYEEEKKWSRIFVGMGTILFFGGGAFVYFVVYPIVFKFLMEFGGGGEVPFISLREYLAFFIRTAFVFALVFELPLIIIFLTKLNVISPETLVRARPYMLIGVAVLSAVITPPDIVSMLLMMAPLYLLFEISIIIGRKLSKV